MLVHEGLPLLGAGDHRMDVAAWLQGLGLERYVQAFRDNEIDWNALPKLSAEDLKDLGVVLGGHRRKLLDAIAALDAETSTARVTAVPRDAPLSPRPPPTPPPRGGGRPPAPPRPPPRPNAGS